MKIGKIFNVVKTFVFKNSPYILSGVGAASVATGAVILVKKAKKQNDFDEEVKTIYEERKQGIEVYGAANEIPADKREKIYRKNIVKLNIWKAGKYTKYYGTPVILISGGTMCMVSAMLIQTKRLKALSVAYTTLASTFADYRQKVKEKIGDKEEQDLFEGTKRDERGRFAGNSKEKLVDNETAFSRLFGEGNSYLWNKNTNHMMLVLKAAEANVNGKLRERGYITLNEVWAELGMKPSSEGAYLGWIYKYGDPKYGSSWIDFGFSGPANSEKVEYYKNCWGEEFWIELIPPHSLIDILPKERVRTKEEKEMIKENRRRVNSLDKTDSDSRYVSDYEIQKAMHDKLRQDLKRASYTV